MISAMENQIKILEDEDIVQFKKDKWFNEELELATSLNFEAKNSCIYADLRKVSRKALFEFMSVAYGNFIKGAKWKAFRDFFYEELKHRYDTIYRAYDRDIANRLPYYDKLYDHQKEAIFLMSNRKYNLLSFEQGLGKTITAISVSNMCNIRTTLIVTPSIAKWNWYEELQKWGEAKDSITIVDSKKTINSDTEKWIVINFELLKKHYDKLVTRNIQHIVVDEAHYIKNVESKRYDYVFNLATESNAKISLLTGTPIKNKVDDLFSYLRLCKQYLGTSYRKFIEEYTYFHNTSYGLSISRGKNLDKLHSMLSNFMIRRTKNECIDLPSKVIQKCYFEFEDYRAEYNAAVKQFYDKASVNSSEAQTSIHTLNIITTKSKIKSICNLVDDLVYQDKDVVIFTSYTEPFDMLVNYFGDRCVAIDGRVPANTRQEIVNQFASDDSKKVFIGNITAAGVGINLVNASEVIFCNLPFTNAELEQAVDRLHRIGQTQNVNVYYTICRNTTDELIYGIIESKASDNNQIVDLYKQTVDLGNLPEKLFRKLKSL